MRLSVTCIAEENGARQQGTSGGGGRVEFSFLTEDDRYLRFVRIAADQALRNLGAVDAPAGTMTVVLGPGWPGVLLHEAVGHGLEGDFNRKKTSAFTDRIGERVASPLCTVVDDGTIANRRGSLNCDDEGTPTGRNVLIEKGILRGYLQDRLNARLMGMPPTGNGRRESFAHMPMPRMTNTFMLAGESTPEEIIRSVPKGLYAASFGGGQVDITNGKFVFSATEAYLIEDGKITRPVKGATLDRQRPGSADPRVDGRQRPGARRGNRHLRQGRTVGAGRRRLADHPHRRHDRRRDTRMSAAALEAIAELLLTEARRLGASAADVVVAEGDSLTVGVRLGEVEKVQRSRAKHLGLRTFVDHSSAITSTADFSADSLRALAADSVALARVTASDEYSGLPAAEDLARTFPTLRLYDPTTREVSAETAAEWCKAAEAAAMNSDPRITNSEGAEFGSGAHRIVYAASNGFRGSYETSSCSLSTVPVAVADGAMERDHWYSARHFLDELEEPEQIGRRAAQRALRRLGSRQVATGEFPVIFDPDMAATLLGHLAAAISGYSLYKGFSFLRDKLGETIAPPFVSVVDDGTLREGLGFETLRRRGVGNAAHQRRRPGSAAQLSLRHLLGAQARRPLDRQRGALGCRRPARQPHQPLPPPRRTDTRATSSPRSPPASTSPS